MYAATLIICCAIDPHLASLPVPYDPLPAIAADAPCKIAGCDCGCREGKICACACGPKTQSDSGWPPAGEGWQWDGGRGVYWRVVRVVPPVATTPAAPVSYTPPSSWTAPVVSRPVYPPQPVFVPQQLPRFVGGACVGGR